MTVALRRPLASRYGMVTQQPEPPVIIIVTLPLLLHYRVLYLRTRHHCAIDVFQTDKYESQAVEGKKERIWWRASKPNTSCRERETSFLRLSRLVFFQETQQEMLEHKRGSNNFTCFPPSRSAISSLFQWGSASATWSHSCIPE